MELNLGTNLLEKIPEDISRLEKLEVLILRLSIVINFELLKVPKRIITECLS